MTIPIKPCPFCGAEAETDTHRGFINSRCSPRNATAIYCTKCDCDMALCHDDFTQYTPEELLAILVETWNRRTP